MWVQLLYLWTLVFGNPFGSHLVQVKIGMILIRPQALKCLYSPISIHETWTQCEFNLNFSNHCYLTASVRSFLLVHAWLTFHYLDSCVGWMVKWARIVEILRKQPYSMSRSVSTSISFYVYYIREHSPRHNGY